MTMFTSLLAWFAGPAEPIASHLEGIEAELRRAEATDDRSGRRSTLLAALTGYRARAVFPHNHVDPMGRRRPVEVQGAFSDRAGATPVFVDEHDTPCAVAHLMRVSGASELVETIRRTRNTAYVHELVDVPGMSDWVASSGFALDELAQIQPSYSYCQVAEAPAHLAHGATGLTGGSAIASTVYLAEGRRPWGPLAVGTVGAATMVGSGHFVRRQCQGQARSGQEFEAWGDVAFFGGIGMLAANAAGFVAAALQKPGAHTPVQVVLGPDRVGIQGRF